MKKYVLKVPKGLPMSHFHGKIQKQWAAHELKFLRASTREAPDSSWIPRKGELHPSMLRKVSPSLN